MLSIIIRFFLFTLCIFYSVFSYSQHQDDRFDDLNKINIPFLEHLTKIKIDSVRKGLGLKPLYNDSILLIAARDHSKYLIGKELSHFQPRNETKKNPQKRAEYYGAVNYLTGENIARTTLNETVSHKLKDRKNEKMVFTVNTYNLVAYSLVVSWVNSPPHYENIVKPDYDVTGLAISIDPQTKQVTAVQKFAHVQYKYEFSNTGSLFPYAEYIPPFNGKDPKDISAIPVRKDYPWNLKPGTTDDHEKVKSIFFQGPNADRIKYNGNEIRLVTYKIKEMKNLLKSKNDGFAIEAVTYEPFHCGNPDYYQLQSRRNNKYIFNGYILKPVYKKEILAGYEKDVKEIKLKKKQDILEIKKSSKLTKEEKKEKIKEVKNLSDEPIKIDTRVGTLTNDLPGGVLEFNLIILQKKRSSYVIHFSNVCDEKDLKDTKLPLFSKFDDVKIAKIGNTKRLTFTVPFDRNSYKITEEQIRTIRDSIPKDLKIKEINIEAWASIEGTEKINLDLQEKRAAAMRNIISYLEFDSTIKINIHAGENWDLFYSQIKDSEYQTWATFTRDEIKKQLEDNHHLEKFSDFLKAQRKAELEIICQKVIDVTADPAMAMGVFRSFIAKIERAPAKSVNAETVRAATAMQKNLYEYLENGKVILREISSISIPQDKRFIPLLINNLWLEYKYTYANKEAAQFPQEFFKLLKFCGGGKNANVVAKYNYCAFVVNAWKEKMYPGSPSVAALEVMINSLSDSLETMTDPDIPLTYEHIHELMFNYHIKRAYFYRDNIQNINELQNSLGYIYSYYRDRELNDSMTYEVASFFSKFSRFDLAKKILKPKVFIENPDVKILSLYLKVSYVHIEETEDESYYEFVMESYKNMTPDQWCSLFIGPCNISFQVFDHEKLRDFYCEKCAGKSNYATKKK